MLARVPEGFGVTLLGKEILPSHSAKDLGVIADSRLIFDEHVTEVVSKCTGSLCQINRVKHLFDRSTLITIVHSLVFSKLFYCSPMWSSTTKNNMARHQKVQNFAAWIVTGARKYEPITPMLGSIHNLPRGGGGLWKISNENYIEHKAGGNHFFPEKEKEMKICCWTLL